MTNPLKAMSGFIFLMMALVFLSGCGVDPLPPADERYVIIDTFNDIPKSVEGMYAIITELGAGYGLFYEDLESGEFIEIDLYENDSTQALVALHLDRKNHLLLAATREHLYFVDTRTNRKTGEINIMNELRTLNAGVISKSIASYAPSHIRIFPYPGNGDYVIYVHQSVFLINLTTLKIEKVVWNSFAYEQKGWEVLVYFPFLSAGSSNLYFHLSLGSGGYGDPETRLTRLDLNTENMTTVYDKYSQEDGGINVFSIDDCAISYSFGTHRIFRFSTSTDALIDSFTLSGLGDQEFLVSAHSTGSGIVVHGINSSQFYTFDCVQDTLELLMDIGDKMPGQISYQNPGNGDLYALVPNTAASMNLVVNLSGKSVERAFRVEHELKEISVTYMVLKEGDDSP